MARPFEHLRPALSKLGESGGRQLLFLHGALHGAWFWEPLAQPLAARGYDVRLLELPGHGTPPWPLPATTSIYDYADLACRAAAELNRPVLVGHSLGGWLAQKVLERADLPTLLLAPMPGGGLPPLRFMRLLAAFPWSLGKTMLGRPMAMKDLAMYRRLFQGSRDPFQAEKCYPRLVEEPVRASLEMGLGLCRARPGRGSAPRLVLAAGDDSFLPPKSLEKLARSLNADFRLLPGVGHHLFWGDQGGEVLEIMVRWLEGLSP